MRSNAYCDIKIQLIKRKLYALLRIVIPSWRSAEVNLKLVPL